MKQQKKATAAFWMLIGGAVLILLGLILMGARTGTAPAGGHLLGRRRGLCGRRMHHAAGGEQKDPAEPAKGRRRDKKVVTER